MKTELEQLVEQLIGKGILLDEAIKEFEKKFILSTLARHDQNLSKAAVALGIHRNTLSKRLVEYTQANGSHPPSSTGSPRPRKTKKSFSQRPKK